MELKRASGYVTFELVLSFLHVCAKIYVFITSGLILLMNHFKIISLQVGFLSNLHSDQILHDL